MMVYAVFQKFYDCFVVSVTLYRPQNLATCMVPHSLHAVVHVICMSLCMIMTAVYA